MHEAIGNQNHVQDISKFCAEYTLKIKLKERIKWQEKTRKRLYADYAGAFIQKSISLQFDFHFTNQCNKLNN